MNISTRGTEALPGQTRGSEALPGLRRSEVRAKLLCTLRVLHRMGAPVVLQRLVAALRGATAYAAALAEELDFVEVFAGAGAISIAMAAHGQRTVSIDLLHGPHMDLSTPEGFVFALVVVLRLRVGGACLCAPPCSSFVWINRGTSKRTRIRPQGDITLPSVRAANQLAARTALLAMVAHAAGAMLLIEQPLSSLLWHYPRMQELLMSVQMHKVTLHLGKFGANTPKPCVFLSNTPRMLELLQNAAGTMVPTTMTVRTVIRSLDAAGRETVRGDVGLKSTQTYPAEFGRQVQIAFFQLETEIESQASQRRSECQQVPVAAIANALAGTVRGGARWLDADMRACTRLIL